MKYEIENIARVTVEISQRLKKEFKIKLLQNGEDARTVLTHAIERYIEEFNQEQDKTTP